MKIATDVELCSQCGLPFAVTLSSNNDLVVMTLQQLHLARGHAQTHYGLLLD